MPRRKTNTPYAYIKHRTYSDGRAVWIGRFVDVWADPSGKTTKEVTLSMHGITTEKQAQAWQAHTSKQIMARKLAIATGAVPARPPMPVDDAIADYLAHCAEVRKPRTVRSYRESLAVFARWCTEKKHAHIDGITAANLSEFWVWLCRRRKQVPKRGAQNERIESTEGKAAYTINRHVQAIRTWLDHLRRLEHTTLTHEQITDAIRKLPTPSAKPQVLSRDDCRRILAAALRRDRAGRVELPMSPLVAVALTTGCRIGELLALRWDQVDLEQQVIRLGTDTKTASARDVSTEISPGLADILVGLKARASGPWVFGGSAAYSYSAVDSARKHIIKSWDSGKWGYHLLRKTCATYLVCSGVMGTVYLAAQQLGHSEEVARKHYLGLVRGLDPNARSLDEVLGVAEELRAIAEWIGRDDDE